MLQSKIISAAAYNTLHSDHDAVAAFKQRGGTEALATLQDVLVAHNLGDSLELHLLHRHMTLDAGEFLVHHPVPVPNVADGAVEVALPIKVDAVDSDFAFAPVMWMIDAKGDLVAYEFGKMERASVSFTPEFLVDFHKALIAVDLADLVSLKNKAVPGGGEFELPELRGLVRVPKEFLPGGFAGSYTGWNVGLPTGHPDPVQASSVHQEKILYDENGKPTGYKTHKVFVSKYEGMLDLDENALDVTVNKAIGAWVLAAA